MEITHPRVRYTRNKFVRTTYLVNPNDAHGYRVIMVEGHGLKARFVTQGKLLIDEITAKWDELEDELRKVIAIMGEIDEQGEVVPGDIDGN